MAMEFDPEDFDEAVGEQQDDMDEALDESEDPVREAWDEELGALALDLQRKTRPSVPLNPVILAALATYLGVKVADIAVRIGQALAASANDVFLKSLESLNEFIKRVTGGQRTVLDDPILLRHVASLRRDHLAAMRQQTAASFGVRTNQKIRDVLMAAGTDRSVGEVVHEVGTLVDLEWWQIQRIVATETAYAYNQAQADGMEQLKRHDPKLRSLMMRWTERIDDAGRVLDKKVAPDSVAMHAQLAAPGNLFIMPPDAAEMKISRGLLGRSWPFPPNRPHDRAVLTPWLRGSGQPGWIWRNGRQELS